MSPLVFQNVIFDPFFRNSQHPHRKFTGSSQQPTIMRVIKQRKSLHKKENNMKKLMVSLLVAGVMVAVIGVTSVVNAQGPVDAPVYQQGGGRGGFGANSADRVENEDVHNLMMEAYSAELGISVAELNAREDAGETMAQIVLSTGLTFDEFRALKTAVNTSVAEQALKAGYIDQAQYEWLLQAAERQMNGQGNGGQDGTGIGTGTRPADGTGFGARGGGMRGTGTRSARGTGLNSANCTVNP
jgi:hypothetical protein